MVALHCFIGLNRSGSKKTQVSKIFTRDVRMLYSFDMIVAYFAIETKTNAIKDYDSILDYWFGMHDENLICDRILNRSTQVLLDKSQVIGIKGKLIMLQGMLEKVDDKLLKDSLINLSTDIYLELLH